MQLFGRLLAVTALAISLALVVLVTVPAHAQATLLAAIGPDTQHLH